MTFNILTAIAMISSVSLLIAQFFTKQVTIRVFILISTFSFIFLLLLFEDNSFISISVLIIYVNALAIVFLFTLMVFMKIEERGAALTRLDGALVANLIFALCYSTPHYIYERLQLNELNSIIPYINPFNRPDYTYWDMYEFVNNFYHYL
jgi:NADH:ubiquinone oxidoreductase subunit 6 (subunit J)